MYSSVRSTVPFVPYWHYDRMLPANREPHCALLKLESWGWKFFSRPVMPTAWITSMTVHKDESGGYCKPGSGYGFSTNEVWVAHGCRGYMKICALRATCVTKSLKSDNYAYLSEKVPGACYVSSMEVKSRDKPPCVAGVNYGFTGPYVWARGGCQANFSICYVE
ncbi:lectin ADEL-like [Aplysia californica]|uniref:Lectin ADEL-like n=1 Tax=Aplysia californica TaxID=6500 RepID=A0ABM1VU75_APLCA|nr:lectin ADEL-like [Aplysia californica]